MCPQVVVGAGVERLQIPEGGGGGGQVWDQDRKGGEIMGGGGRRGESGVRQEDGHEYDRNTVATLDLVHPKMSPTLTFSIMYQKQLIYRRIRTNYK